MIIVELVDNETRERRYSDKNVKLLQKETGILYDDAVDVIPCKYTYEESDEPIVVPEEPIDVSEQPPMIPGFIPPNVMQPPVNS